MERLTEIEYKGKAYRVRLRKIMPAEFNRLIEKDTIIYNDDHKEFRMNGEAIAEILPETEDPAIPFVKISLVKPNKIWRKYEHQLSI